MKPISLLIPAKGVLEVSWLGLPFRAASSSMAAGLTEGLVEGPSVPRASLVSD